MEIIKVILGCAILAIGLMSPLILYAIWAMYEVDKIKKR